MSPSTTSAPMPLYYPVMAPYRMVEENEESSLPFDEILNDTDAQMKSQFQLQQDMLLQNDFMHWRTMPDETREGMQDYGRSNGGNDALQKKMEGFENLDKGKSGDKQSSTEKRDSVSSFGQEREQEQEREQGQEQEREQEREREREREQEEGEGMASHSPFMFTSAVIVRFSLSFRTSWEILMQLSGA